VGFNSAWGYWISALLANVSYASLMFAAISYFFPVFGEGNNIPSMICASIIIWSMVYLVSKGVKEAAGVNLVITISKIIPIFVFILAIIFIRAFDFSVFMNNFWGEQGGMAFMDQIKATMITTVWAFLGIEGAVVISGRAKKSRDVRRATITAFLCVLAIYIMVSLLSMGVMPREELATIGNPPMAFILESVVGKWGAVIVNIGVVLSLAGATLGYTIIAAECPYIAAKNGVFPKIFAKENKNGAPIASLLLTNGIIQVFLVITYFNSSTYQIFYTLSASMILVPYLLSALYFLRLTLRRETFEKENTKTLLLNRFIALLASVYGMWLMYASGFSYLLITAILYVPGTIVYIIAKKEQGKEYLNNTRDKIIFAILVVLAVISLILIANGTLQPF
jgi:arginine:ornithine antiporter/lysine permease